MRSSPSASMTTRQKMTIGLFIVVIIIVAWQLISLFKGSNGASSSSAIANNKMMAGGNTIPSPPPTPQAVSLPKAPVLSEREMELMKLQKQTEEKYIAALNQLQMLKIERDIAETNKAIVTAKLDTATAEKSMANLLQPPVSPGTYAQGLANPSSVQQGVSPAISSNYIVISVSLLQGRWSAVLGNQGKLYQVYVDDTLPDDGAKVISIDRSGVTLKYGEEKKKISLVPII